MVGYGSTTVFLGFPFALLALLQGTVSADVSVQDAAECNKDYGALDFLVVDGDATGTAVEDDIRIGLEAVGFTVNTVFKSKDDWNTAMTTGNFHLAFTESWGNPYDPHSYASGWINGTGGEGHHQAFSNFEAPKSREELYGLISDALGEENRSARRAKWVDIHNYYHSQAVMLPLWGKRIPALLNTRLSGYQAGHQQFDYPVHKLTPLSGSSNITIAPGAQTGLFTTIGRLDPHTYRPNEFFANNWVYEGLVSYGEGGQVLPALATSWTKADSSDGAGETHTFQLRQNVTFHDGQPWNCAAAKLNFDHVFAGGLTTPDWHGWYGVPLYIKSWECTGTMEFVVKTTIKYAPFLQELSYIRPLRMLSPGAFANGATTDAFSANSCHAGWGSVESPDHDTVNCTGIKYISGTGPFVFESRDPKNVTAADGSVKLVDNQVVFSTNQAYWGGPPAFDNLIVQYYPSSADVKAALIDQSLDVVWGAGVLSDQDIASIQNDDSLVDIIRTFYSADLQNVIMLLNSGKAPLDNIEVRKIVIHAINKAAIVEQELAGQQTVVDNVFPLTSPNSNIALTPRWDYDIEKASLISCEIVDTGSGTNTLALGLGIGFGCAALIGIIAAVYYFNRSKELEVELQQKEGAVHT